MTDSDLFDALPPKHPDENILLRFDLTDLLEDRWRKDTYYAANDYVRPLTRGLFEYQASQSGKTGRREPIWPQTLSGTVDDGQVQWTAVALGTNAIDSIATAVVTGSPDLTISADVIASPLVTVPVAGGRAGRDYEIKCVVTTASGRTWVAIGSLPVRA